MSMQNPPPSFVVCRRIISLTAALCSLTIAVAQNAPAASDPERPEIIWRKRAPDGRDLGLAAELNPPKARPTAPDKKPEAKGQPAGSARLDTKMFLDSDTYYGELPAKLRQEVSYVHFALDATAQSNPGEGTVLNIDGAIVGFRARRDEITGRGTAELVTMDVSADGKPEWKGTGIIFMLSPQRGFTGAPMLCAKLDPKNDVWTLYYRDIIVRENLPLLTTATAPTISTRAGKVGDAAMLLDFKIAPTPPARNPAYVRSVNGRIDLAKARREGHPYVRASGEQFPAQPTQGTQPGGK